MVAFARRPRVYRRSRSTRGAHRPSSPAAFGNEGATRFFGSRVARAAVHRRNSGHSGRLTIMQLLDPMFDLPVDPELWIVICYVVVVLIGARITELLARAHFAQARRRAERGFEYVADEDHYRCSEGERLSLYDIDSPRGIAVYQG